MGRGKPYNYGKFIVVAPLAGARYGLVFLNGIQFVCGLFFVSNHAAVAMGRGEPCDYGFFNGPPAARWQNLWYYMNSQLAKTN